MERRRLETLFRALGAKWRVVVEKLISDRSPRHFSLREMFIGLTLFGAACAIARVGGWTAAWVLMGLWAVYAFSLAIPRRARKWFMIVSYYFAAIPWLGCGYAFVFPGRGQLPTLYPCVHGTPIESIVWILTIPYFLAEFPLAFACGFLEFGEYLVFGDFVYFQRSAAVRPFFVFIFWLLVALAATLAHLRCRRPAPQIRRSG